MEWAAYWNVFSRNLGKIWCAKIPQCHFWNHGYFKTVTGRYLFPGPYTFSLDTPFPPIPIVLSTNERDDNRPQTSKHYFVSSRFILSFLSKSDKKGPAWNQGSQGYLNPFSTIVLFLATPNDTSLHHLTPKQWRKTLLRTYHTILKFSVEYFKKVPQVTAWSTVVQ